MKSNRKAFQERETRNRSQFSGFKTCNSFPFNKAPQKAAHFSAVFGQTSQAHPDRNRVQSNGENDVLCRGAMPVTNLDQVRAQKRRLHLMSAEPQLRSLAEGD